MFTHNLSYWTIQFLCEVYSFTGKILSLLENNCLPQILLVANNMWQGDFFLIFFFKYTWGVTDNSTPLKNALSCFKSSYYHWTILEVCTLKEIRLCLKQSRLIIPSTWNCIFLHYECCLISGKWCRSLVSHSDSWSSHISWAISFFLVYLHDSTYHLAH